MDCYYTIFKEKRQNNCKKYISNKYKAFAIHASAILNAVEYICSFAYVAFRR